MVAAGDVAAVRAHGRDDTFQHGVDGWAAGGQDEVYLFDRTLSAEEVASLVKGEEIKATVEKKAGAKN